MHLLYFAEIQAFKTCISYSSEAVMRLDYQLLQKSPPLNLLVGSAPATSTRCSRSSRCNRIPEFWARPWPSWTRSWTTFSKGSPPRRHVLHTTISERRSAPWRSRLPCVSYCPASWPNTPCLRAPKLSPSSLHQLQVDALPLGKRPTTWRRTADSIWIRCKDWRCVVWCEIDFLLKICDRFLACFTCGVKLLEYIYVQVWIIAKRWNQSHLADSSKAYRKPRAFICCQIHM